MFAHESVVQACNFNYRIEPEGLLRAARGQVG